MARKTLTSTRNGDDIGPMGLRRNMADFGHDLTTLLELQGRLAKADANEASKRIVWPVIFGGVGLVLILGMVPVALEAVAMLLVQQGVAGEAGALGIVAGVATIVAAVFLFLAKSYASSVLEPFDRSQSELSRNVQWVKHVLKHSGRK